MEDRVRSRAWSLHGSKESKEEEGKSFSSMEELGQELLERSVEGPPEKVRALWVGEPPFAARSPWWTLPALVAWVADHTPPPAGGSTEPPEPPEPAPRAEGPILVEERVVRRLLAAMCTRPLVLLAGVSGSGKTQVARRLGKAWAAGVIRRDRTVEQNWQALQNGWLKQSDRSGWFQLHDLHPSNLRPERYGFTAVQSDWTDASHLWGYHVPLPESAAGFYGTQALRVFLSAATSVEPHFLLLDEMNLSRPEHYASDLLSAMEVIPQPVIELHRAGQPLPLRGAGDRAGGTVPARVGWGEGLVVVGTVNVDETTFSFAPKVLDRAALLEFVDVDLETVMPAILEGEGLKVWNDPLVRGWFLAVQTLGRPYQLHLGYRAAREIVLGLRQAAPKDPSNLRALLDQQLRDKVLPRVRGSRAQVQLLLTQYAAFAEAFLEDKTFTAPANALTLQEIETRLATPAGSAAARKALEMLRRAHTVGFTSYFG